MLGIAPGWEEVLVTSLAERKIRGYIGRQPHSLSKAEALEMAGAFAAMAMRRGQGLMPPPDIQDAMKTYIIAVWHE